MDELQGDIDVLFEPPSLSPIDETATIDGSTDFGFSGQRREVRRLRKTVESHRRLVERLQRLLLMRDQIVKGLTADNQLLQASLYRMKEFLQRNGFQTGPSPGMLSPRLWLRRVVHHFRASMATSSAVEELNSTLQRTGASFSLFPYPGSIYHWISDSMARLLGSLLHLLLYVGTSMLLPLRLLAPTGPPPWTGASIRGQGAWDHLPRVPCPDRQAVLDVVFAFAVILTLVMCLAAREERHMWLGANDVTRRYGLQVAHEYPSLRLFAGLPDPSLVLAPGYKLKLAPMVVPIQVAYLSIVLFLQECIMRGQAGVVSGWFGA